MNPKVFLPLPVIDCDYNKTAVLYHPTSWPKWDPDTELSKKYVTVRNRIRVSKLDPETKQGDLHEEFSCFGPIASITKMKIFRTNDIDRKKEGYSYITYFLEKDAELALKSDTKFLNDHSILVEQAIQEPKYIDYRILPVKRIYSMQTMLAIQEKYKKLFLKQDVGCNEKVCYTFICKIDPNMPKNMKRSTILDPTSDDESSSTSWDCFESCSIRESNPWFEEQVLESHSVKEPNPWLEKQIPELIPVVPQNAVSIIGNGLEFNPENVRGLNDSKFNNVVYPNPIYIESDQMHFQYPDYLNYQESEFRGLNNVEFNNFVYPKPIYIESEQTYLEDSDYLNYQKSEYPLPTSSAYYDENQILQDNVVPVRQNDDYYDLNNKYCIPEENINYDPYHVDPSMYQDALVPIVNLNSFETEYNQFYDFSPTVIATFHEYEMNNQLNMENQYADLPDSNYIQVHSSQLHEYETNYQNYDGAQGINLTGYEEVEMSNMQLNYGTFEVPHLIEQPMILPACEMQQYETNYQYYDDAKLYDLPEHDNIDMPIMPIIQENDSTYEVPYLIEQSMIPPACKMQEYQADYQYYDAKIYDLPEHGNIDMPMIQENDGTYEVPHLIEQPMISSACEMQEYETNYQYYDDAKIYVLPEHGNIDMPMIQENDGTYEVPHLIEQPMISSACEMQEYETNYQYYDDAKIYVLPEQGNIDMPMIQENDGTYEVPHLIEQPMIASACEMQEYETNYQYYDDAKIYVLPEHGNIDMPMIQENDGTYEVPHLIEQPMISSACEMQEYETNYQYYDDAKIYVLPEHGNIDMPMIQENDGTYEVPHLIEQPMISSACEMQEYETDYQYYDDAKIYDLPEHDNIDMTLMPMIQGNDGTYEVPYLIEQQMIPLTYEMHEYKADYRYHHDPYINDFANYNGVEVCTIQENYVTSEVPHIVEQETISPACEIREYETDREAEIIDSTENDDIEMSMTPENDSTSGVSHMNQYQHYSVTCDELLKQLDFLKEQFRKSHEVDKPHIVKQQTIPPACEINEYKTNDEAEESSMIPENDSTSEVPRINPYQHFSATCDILLKQLDVLKDQFHKSLEVEKHDELSSQCNVNDTVEDANNSVSRSDTQDCSASNQFNLLQITETVIELSTSINEEIEQDPGKSEIELQIPDKTQDKCEIIDESSKCDSYVTVRDVATQFPEHDENFINTSTPEENEASLQNMETQTADIPENANKESTPLRMTFANITKRGKRPN